MLIRSKVAQFATVMLLLGLVGGCSADPASRLPRGGSAGSGTLTGATLPGSPTIAPASTAPMVAIVTRADWCSVCRANGERAGKVLFEEARDGSIEVVLNDITSDQTAARSLAVMEPKGLSEISQGASAGTISFIDSRTHRRVAEVTVAHQDDEIRLVIEVARKRLSR